jgi:hypothetical protein
LETLPRARLLLLAARTGLAFDLRTRGGLSWLFVQATRNRFAKLLRLEELEVRFRPTLPSPRVVDLDESLAVDEHEPPLLLGRELEVDRVRLVPNGREDPALRTKRIAAEVIALRYVGQRARHLRRTPRRQHQSLLREFSPRQVAT